MRSLRSRLFAAIALVVVVSIGAMFLVGAGLTRRAVEDAILDDVSHQADLIARRERAAVAPLVHLRALRHELASQGGGAESVRLDRSSPYLPADRARLVRSGRPVQGTIVVNGVTYFYAARKVTAERALVVVRKRNVGMAAWRPYLQGLWIAALIGAALAAVAAFFLARAIARPVGRVARATGALVATDAPEPIPVEGPEELRRLAEAFNDMAFQLGRARAAERHFLLSVSHELKTPLTAIRGYAEGISEDAIPADEAADVIWHEAARLERLVRDLLDLARLNRSEFAIRREAVDLAHVVEEAARRFEPQAREFEVSLERDAREPAAALGDPDRVLQVVSNLLENALRLTPPGGAVRLVAEGTSVSVEDSGPGLRPEELPRAFERFFLYSRYGGERPVGTGLGLAIVKELVEGMGGAVEVESEPGRGARFTVRLRPADAGVPEAAERDRLVRA